MSNTLPRRRTQSLSIQHVGQETLVYDEQTHKAFCLNPVAAAVWNRCDGEMTIAAIAASASLALSLPVTDELVQLSLGDLTRDGLLESAALPATALSRRDVLMKLGARAALLLPVIVAIETPMAAQAYGGCVNCTPPPPQPAHTPSGSGPGGSF
jgi:hypothetical protein